MDDILIIGAGMAGLACGTALARAGHAVRLFDKGRGPGGRMATRRVDHAGEQLRFDHGAQYFTATDEAFQQTVEDWERAGVVARWPAASDDAWVGLPGMNAPLKAMAQNLDVTWSARIEAVNREDEGWSVVIDGHAIHCTTLLIAIPPEQVAMLLEEPAPDLADRARATRSQPCWAVMAQFDAALGITSDTVRSSQGPIAWAARNSAKPGRDGGESWVIHASPERSRELLELDKGEVANALLANFFGQAGIAAQSPSYATAHRWLYALPQVEDAPGAIWDAQRQLGLAGDWLHFPRVEGAWRSGTQLARAVVADCVQTV